MTAPLDFALMSRLREVLADRPPTEGELRTLCDQADAWARTLQAQIEGGERRLRELTTDPASPLSEIAPELRRLEALRPELAELRSLIADLDRRARELRTEWLMHQAESNPGGDRS